MKKKLKSDKIAQNLYISVSKSLTEMIFHWKNHQSPKKVKKSK